VSITGGIKFFDENLCLVDNGGSCVASTGTAVQSNIIDKFAWTYWTSVGSNDSTVETLTLTFPSATFSRLLLLDHNWKQYTAKYWNGASFVNFTSVVGLDGSVSNISETVFADTASYYEFASVTTTQIQLTVTKTQTANAEKYLATVMLTNDLGTLQGYPKIDPVSFNKNDRQMQMLSGRVKLVKQNPVFSCSLKFDNYPNTKGSDIDLVMTLFDRETPFHVWLCGGRRGTKYFNYAMRGFRLKDIYRVQVVSQIAPVYMENIYTSGISNLQIDLVEHV
jgi:hypothetical protein